MQETLLIRFFKSLSSNEIRQFKDFIYSPLFNKNRNISELFEIHYKYYPGFETEELSEQKLFEKIFINEKFQYFKIKNLISDLFALGKEFLAITVYRKDHKIQERNLLFELRKRNLDVTFEKTHKNAIKQLEKNTAKDEYYYLHEMDLQFEHMLYNTQKNPNENFHHKQERLDIFINYSMITLLKMYNIMLHENNQNNYKYDMKMFDHVMEYLERYDFKDNPTLEVYYFILKMEMTKEDKYFYILRELRKKYFNNLTKFDNYMLFLHLDGFCATAYNNFCRTDLLKEQFILSKENSMIDTSDLGKLLYPDFINEVKKAARVNEFEYAEEYILKFQDKLSEEKENSLNFCFGYVSYYKGELDKALDYFSKTNFSNYLIKIQVKILLLQLSIDKGYFDQAELMIDSFRHYIPREKSILDSVKNSMLEFLKITSDLIKIKTEVSDKNKDYKIEKIKKEIENMSNNRFGIQIWLKEKIRQ